MSSVDQIRRASLAGSTHHALLVLAVFTLALFVSAFLLFSVQPLFAKMVLPLLGGSPGVWSVLLVCFQGALLGGYAYAFAITRWMNPAARVSLHLFFLSIVILVLPFAIPEGFGAPPESGQEIWLVGLFMASVGLPFFLVSSHAPLLQGWFAELGHRHSCDPYFLYGASNIGSFIALLGYPFLIEPTLRLGTQVELWSIGFLGLVVLVCLCALCWVLKGQHADVTVGSAADAAEDTPPTIARRAIWVLLAAIPSGLLVAVTAHISTDVAAAPFLWVLPLALFLLTFVVVFRRKPLINMVTLGIMQTVLLALLLLPSPMLLSIFLHLTVFFVSALICHGELYSWRPSSGYLTEFYLWMSIGGVLGGIFASLLAPQIFDGVYEYPILLLAAAVCRRDVWQRGLWTNRKLIALSVIAVAAVAPRLLSMASALTFGYAFYVVAAAAIAIIVFYKQPVYRIAALMIGLIVLNAYPRDGLPLYAERSFFGVSRVFNTADQKFRFLVHGSTMHGIQALTADGSLEDVPVPRAYYGAGGGIADSIQDARAHGANTIAAIGLGTGTVACWRDKNENWTFYEIDPDVVKIAKTPRLFSFLSRCAPDARIIVGDGRIKIAEQPAGTYDVIIVDAFSSDAIPVHLMTSEAIEQYLRVLAPGGRLVFHISNRYLELSQVLASFAAQHGVAAKMKRRSNVGDDLQKQGYAPSWVVTMARVPEVLSGLDSYGDWKPLEWDGVTKMWTDDYSDIISAIVRQRNRKH